MLRKLFTLFTFCCFFFLLHGVSFAAAHTVLLVWVAPSPLPSPTLASYHVQKGDAGHETFLFAVTYPTLTYTDAAVTAGQTYCYRVTSVNINGVESIQGNEACVTIPNVSSSVSILDFGRRLRNSGPSATQDVVFTNDSGGSVIVEDDTGIGFLSGIRVTGSFAPFVLTSAANASGGNTVYTGTITGGGSNAFAGQTFNVSGFDLVANNTVSDGFLCIASTGTTLTLVNAGGVADTHAATASGSIQFIQTNALGTLPQTVTDTSTFTVHLAFNPLIAGPVTGGLTVHLHDGSDVKVNLIGIVTTPTPAVADLQTDDVSLPFPNPIQPINAQHVNGIAPGFFPQACGGLVLCVGKGIFQDGSSGTWVIRNIPAVTPTLGNNTTTHIYLDHTDNFLIHTSTSAVPCHDFWIGDAVTLSGVITSVLDYRALGTRTDCP